MTTARAGAVEHFVDSASVPPVAASGARAKRLRLMDLSGVAPLYPEREARRDVQSVSARARAGVERSRAVPQPSAAGQAAGQMDRQVQRGPCADMPPVAHGTAVADHDLALGGALTAAASGTSEWPINDPPRRDSTEREDIGAQREVLLWQRWARYAAAVLMAGSAAILQHDHQPQRVWLGLAAVAAGYCAATAAMTRSLRSDASEVVSTRLSAVVLTLDLGAAAAAVYLTAPSGDYDRFLILALAVLQVAVVYHGLSFAAVGMAGALVAYLVGSLLLPPAVHGPSADARVVSMYAATFVFAGCALLYAFGSFRTRMNALRRFCRDVEIGELGGSFDARGERRPDDLTLLARSVDEMRQRLIELIGTDPLTECLNRRALETRLARECRLARRRGTALTVLAVDVDHFKSINDTYGHPFGDYVLQTVADIMNETARDTDVVARLGGDEFVLVLTDTGWQGATTFAERLRSNVDDHTFGDQTTSLEVTISVGVAVAPVIGAHSPATLLAEADRSLYRAKSAGRNRISA